jgi:multiple sugar transport system permease protein
VFTTGKNADDELIIPIRMAGTVIAILPMFFVYFGFRRKIMQAISRQGIATKG